MTRSMLAGLLLLSAATPAVAAERNYTVTDFDRVQVDGPYRVTLAVGKASSAKALGSNAALDRISIEVQGKTLRIRSDQSAWGGYPGDALGAVTIQISTAGLRYAGINGGGTLTIDKAKAMRLDLSVVGSGRIEAGKVEADTLYLNLFGSGQMQVAGKTKSVRAEVHGSGDLAAAGLSAADAQVIADTAGSIKLEATRSAKITSTATGDVEISGAAACTVKELGTSRIRCGS